MGDLDLAVNFAIQAATLGAAAFAEAQGEVVGDEFFGLLVRLSNGQRKVLMFLSDPEGDGPGSFDLSDS